MSTQPSQKSGWHKILDDLNLTASTSEPPSGRPAPTSTDTNDVAASQTTWLQALACFARTGFLRILLGETPSNLELYIQIAAGSALQTPELLTSALAAHTRTPWTAHVTTAPFELSTTLPQSPTSAEETHAALRNALVALMKLGDLIASDTTQLTPETIASALSFSPATTPTSPQNSSTETTPPTETTEDTFFETIGVPSQTNAPAPPDIAHFDITQHEKSIEIALHLTTLLRPSEHIELAKALAHHLRARFDANVLPAPESVAVPTTPDIKTSTIRLNADASEESQRTPTGHAELAKNFTAFFNKAQEWAKLGIDIFELVGLKHANSTPDAIHFTTTSATPKTTQTPQTTPSTTSDDIVFDLSSRPSYPTNTNTSSPFTFSNNNPDGLTRGNFTDERLKRGDAVTPLVDLVLRHPGYSDRRIGQVLSIILSIDYHAALRLVENAPCVIAWGLAQKTASNYKDVIETTGGKALLVEPDTFREP